VTRSDACGVKACGSATPVTWGAYTIKVSASVSRKNCSTNTYAIAYVVSDLSNGRTTTGSDSAIDRSCDGAAVANNQIYVDGGTAKVLNYRVVVGLADGTGTVNGNKVDNPVVP
jgi:hypothetical protein